MNFPWGHNRRFNSYSEYFKIKFGSRIQKVAVDAGFSCPNRDGTLGVGGCTYCNNQAFNPSYCLPEKPIRQQIDEGIEFHLKRYRRAKQYLAYFQPYSNTHAPLERLKEIYDEAIHHPLVCGLVIGTRPDCVDEGKLDYFKKLSETHYVIIEYGVESCNDQTLRAINRLHTFDQSKQAIQLTASKGIMTGAHFIFGLPGETREEMLNEASVISALPLTTVKFHQLQIVKNTPMAKQYLDDPGGFQFFTLDEYVDFIVDFLGKLNPAFVVERFAGEVPPRFLAGPGWGLIRNDQIVHRIEQRLEERNTWQGKNFG